MRTAPLKVTVICLVLVWIVRAGESAGGQGGAFLRNPVGARPAGMGDAFVAVADDANALLYNPGGLYQTGPLSLGGMYSLMGLGRRHYQASLSSTSQNLGSLGLMLVAYEVTGIDGRDEFGNPTAKFDDSEMALTLGYGRQLLAFLGAGLGGRLLYQTLETGRFQRFP